MKRFVVPTIFNNFVLRDEAGFVKENGFGTGIPFEFMTAQLMIAAQRGGYEVYSMLYDTLKKDDSGVHRADLVKTELDNLDLLDRISRDEAAIRRLIALSNEVLSKQKQVLTSARDEKVAEIAALESKERSKKEDLQLEEMRKILDSQNERLGREGNWKHDIRNWCLGVVRLGFLADHAKNPAVLDFLRELAAADPAIKFDETKPFIKRTRVENVDLAAFLEAGKKDNENVFYIRDFREGEEFAQTNQFFEYLENLGVKFPTSMTTLMLHEKMVVKENPQLERHSLPMECFDARDLAAMAKFYKTHGRSEGVVLKPYLVYGGKSVFFLEPGIADENLEERLQQISHQIKIQSAEITQRPEIKGSIDFSKIIMQKKLHNLFIDKEHDLYAGDVRFTAINGELVGAAMRYSEGEEEKALSYEGCRNLLPDNKLLTRENILAVLSEAGSDALKQEYYQNILAAYDAAQSVSSWCKEQGHFHVGFDILIGRDSAGKWTHSLTELNVGWPDCIPEHSWIDDKCGSNRRICDDIVESLAKGNYISPLKLRTQTTNAAAPNAAAPAIANTKSRHN